MLSDGGPFVAELVVQRQDVPVLCRRKGALLDLGVQLVQPPARLMCVCVCVCLSVCIRVRVC